MTSVVDSLALSLPLTQTHIPLRKSIHIHIHNAYYAHVQQGYASESPSQPLSCSACASISNASLTTYTQPLHKKLVRSIQYKRGFGTFNTCSHLVCTRMSCTRREKPHRVHEIVLNRPLVHYRRRHVLLSSYATRTHTHTHIYTSTPHSHARIQHVQKQTAATWVPSK
jgi:hypothetical protein